MVTKDQYMFLKKGIRKKHPKYDNIVLIFNFLIVSDYISY